MATKLKNMGDIVGRAADPRTFKDSASLPLSSCYLGVEVEMEGVNKAALAPEISQWWKIKDDGSLREGGAEFCFHAPYRGEDTLTAISALFDNQQPSWDASVRCGVHVHLDVRNLSPDQLGALATLYACLEGPLFKFAGEDRRDNHFCLAWANAPADLRWISTIIHEKSERTIEKALGNTNKYSALNFESLRRFGSIEFRQMGGTRDKERVLAWCRMILRLKKVVLYTANTPSAVFRLISESPLGLLDRVLDQDAHYCMYPGAEQDIYQGIELAHTFVVPRSVASRQLEKD